MEAKGEISESKVDPKTVQEEETAIEKEMQGPKDGDKDVEYPHGVKL